MPTAAAGGRRARRGAVVQASEEGPALNGRWDGRTDASNGERQEKYTALSKWDFGVLDLHLLRHEIVPRYQWHHYNIDPTEDEPRPVRAKAGSRYFNGNIYSYHMAGRARVAFVIQQPRMPYPRGAPPTVRPRPAVQSPFRPTNARTGRPILLTRARSLARWRARLLVLVPSSHVAVPSPPPSVIKVTYAFCAGRLAGCGGLG